MFRSTAGETPDGGCESSSRPKGATNPPRRDDPQCCSPEGLHGSTRLWRPARRRCHLVGFQLDEGLAHELHHLPRKSSPSASRRSVIADWSTAIVWSLIREPWSDHVEDHAVAPLGRVEPLHVAFLLLHNRLMDQEAAAGNTPREAFERAQRLAQWHFQWVVVHGFLRRTLGDELHSRLLITTKSRTDRCARRCASATTGTSVEPLWLFAIPFLLRSFSVPSQEGTGRLVADSRGQRFRSSRATFRVIVAVQRTPMNRTTTSSHPSLK